MAELQVPSRSVAHVFQTPLRGLASSGFSPGPMLATRAAPVVLGGVVRGMVAATGRDVGFVPFREAWTELEAHDAAPTVEAPKDSSSSSPMLMRTSLAMERVEGLAGCARGRAEIQAVTVQPQTESMTVVGAIDAVGRATVAACMLDASTERLRAVAEWGVATPGVPESGWASLSIDSSATTVSSSSASLSALHVALGHSMRRAVSFAQLDATGSLRVTSTVPLVAPPLALLFAPPSSPLQGVCVAAESTGFAAIDPRLPTTATSGPVVTREGDAKLDTTWALAADEFGLAVGGRGSFVRLFDVRRWKLVGRLNAPVKNDVSSIALVASRRLVFVSGSDQEAVCGRWSLVGGGSAWLSHAPMIRTFAEAGRGDRGEDGEDGDDANARDARSGRGRAGDGKRRRVEKEEGEEEGEGEGGEGEGATASATKTAVAAANDDEVDGGAGTGGGSSTSNPNPLKKPVGSGPPGGASGKLALKQSSGFRGEDRWVGFGGALLWVPRRWRPDGEAVDAETSRNAVRGRRGGPPGDRSAKEGKDSTAAGNKKQKTVTEKKDEDGASGGGGKSEVDGEDGEEGEGEAGNEDGEDGEDGEDDPSYLSRMSSQGFEFRGYVSDKDLLRAATRAARAATPEEGRAIVEPLLREALRAGGEGVAVSKYEGKGVEKDEAAEAKIEQGRKARGLSARGGGADAVTGAEKGKERGKEKEKEKESGKESGGVRAAHTPEPSIAPSMLKPRATLPSPATSIAHVFLCGVTEGGRAYLVRHAERMLPPVLHDDLDVYDDEEDAASADAMSGDVAK